MSKSKKKTVFLLQVDRKTSGKSEAFGYCDPNLPVPALQELLVIANALIKGEMGESTYIEPESVSQSTSFVTGNLGSETYESESDDLRGFGSGEDSSSDGSGPGDNAT